MQNTMRHPICLLLLVSAMHAAQAQEARPVGAPLISWLIPQLAALGLAVLLGYYWLAWSKVGWRKPMPVIRCTEPPIGISPAAVTLLAPDDTDWNEIPRANMIATLLNLAIKGYLCIHLRKSELSLTRLVNIKALGPTMLAGGHVIDFASLLDHLNVHDKPTRQMVGQLLAKYPPSRLPKMDAQETTPLTPEETALLVYLFADNKVVPFDFQHREMTEKAKELFEKITEAQYRTGWTFRYSGWVYGGICASLLTLVSIIAIVLHTGAADLFNGIRLAALMFVICIVFILVFGSVMAAIVTDIIRSRNKPVSEARSGCIWFFLTVISLPMSIGGIFILAYHSYSIFVLLLAMIALNYTMMKKLAMVECAPRNREMIEAIRGLHYYLSEPHDIPTAGQWMLLLPYALAMGVEEEWIAHYAESHHGILPVFDWLDTDMTKSPEMFANIFYEFAVALGRYEETNSS